jgi:hypothetical protein
MLTVPSVSYVYSQIEIPKRFSLVQFPILVRGMIDSQRISRA